METTPFPARKTPEQRVSIAMAVAETFANQLLYVRDSSNDAGQSELPLTDLYFDGMLLTRLAAAFDGYDFDFNQDNEPHHYHFLVHLLAAAMCPLIGEGDDLDEAIADALAVIRERRDIEARNLIGNDGCSETGRPLIPMIGDEKFTGL